MTGDDFIRGGDFPNKGRIKTARYGWLCAECYDELEAAWNDWLEHHDKLEVFDRGGDPSSKLESYLVRPKLPMQASTWSIGAIFIACQSSYPMNSKARPACSMSRT